MSEPIPALHGRNLAATPQDLASYKTMLLIRRFEEKVGQLYGLGLIRGYCHLYVGQEAIVAGMQRSLTPEDQVIAGHRDHAHALACGVDPRKILAELLGRRTGLSKGKGGSMHLFARDKNFYGGQGIVAAQVSIGTGVALANRMRKSASVTLAYFGDGAANQGQVYECFNMARLWKLPIVYIIENNRYAMGTSVDRASAVTDFARRGEAFDIPGARVDGMDLHAVIEAGAKAVQWSRAGQGPYLLEMQTYRYRGHSLADPAKYRSAEEVEKIRQTQDPLDKLRDELIEAALISPEEVRALETSARAQVNAAAEYAAHQLEPDAAELLADVLA